MMATSSSTAARAASWCTSRSVGAGSIRSDPILARLKTLPLGVTLSGVRMTLCVTPWSGHSRHGRIKKTSVRGRMALKLGGGHTERLSQLAHRGQLQRLASFTAADAHDAHLGALCQVRLTQGALRAPTAPHEGGT